MDDYELLATQAELGAQMLSKVQVVQVIDSMVVDKDDFFLHYKLSSEVGSLHDYHSLTGDDRPGASPVFQTQRRDKILYAVPTEDAGYELVTRIRLGDDTYSEEELIDDLNTMYDDSYPFLLTDGVTFYFASNEEDRTLGGYDIFVTKYNINTDEYSDPEQLPMPFNSPYNDYMMAIDEVNHVGWFASDRYQPEGKVCIYIFLYEKTPEFPRGSLPSSEATGPVGFDSGNVERRGRLQARFGKNTQYATCGEKNTSKKCDRFCRYRSYRVHDIVSVQE